MKKPHIIEIFSYMYQLNVRNLKAYKRPVVNPVCEPLLNNSVHWVGHATTVINLNGKIIVTDPVTGNLGYIKRLVNPSINLKKLKADYIILTHGHMDHLKYKDLMKMNKDAVAIVPKGVSKTLRLLGFKKIYVLKDKDTYKDSFIEINCIGAEHNGRRYYIFGYKQSNSYIIKSKDKSVLFAGDTKISTKYSNINADAAIMPVGCYKPDEYLSMHCSPQQSFNMFKMSHCNYMIPIHYKTYILSQDDDEETERILKKLNDGTIKIINIGQTVKI